MLDYHDRRALPASLSSSNEMEKWIIETDSKEKQKSIVPKRRTTRTPSQPMQSMLRPSVVQYRSSQSIPPFLAKVDKSVSTIDLVQL